MAKKRKKVIRIVLKKNKKTGKMKHYILETKK